jgi:hypothetical protein
MIGNQFDRAAKRIHHKTPTFMVGVFVFLRYSITAASAPSC